MLEVQLGTLAPVAPQPGDTLVVAGTLHNVSRSTVDDVAVQLRLGQAVATRSEFDAYAAAAGQPLPSDLAAVTPAVPARPTRLAAGASEPFRITVPVAALGLPSTWQVRELGITAAGATGDGFATLGQLRTFLPWAPRNVPGNGLPTKVAWVWPLVDRPHRGSANRWTDDSLAPELAAGGRLADLLAAGRSAQTAPTPHARRHGRRAVPLTWALDPMLVEDAELMSTGYTVGTGSSSRPGVGRAAAVSWLAGLRGAVSRTGAPSASILPLPYADPDVVAATRGSLGTEVGVAVTNGRALLSHALPTSRILSAGWPPDGAIDQRSVDTLFAARTTTLVLSDQALPIVGGEPSETPSAKTVLATADGDVDALLTNSDLTAAVQDGATDPASSRTSLQRYLAETLLIQNEAPSDQRSVVVAPNRRWAPTGAYATALLRDTGDVPWIQPVSLASVAAGPAYTKVTRSSLDYPAAARHRELPGGYVHDVKSLLGAAGDFGSILTSGDSAVRDYDGAAQRALSSGWRGDAERTRVLATDRAALAKTMSAVHIASQNGSFVTLTSHHGEVPVTIANDLGTAVRIMLLVEPNQRLTLASGGRVVRVIPAHQPLTLDVHAAAKTSGVFPLQVRLLTPGGRQYGGVVRLNVRSTVYGTVTLVITGAATVALLLAAGIRLVRRGLRARRSPGAGAPEPSQ